MIFREALAQTFPLVIYDNLTSVSSVMGFQKSCKPNDTQKTHSKTSDETSISCIPNLTNIRI